MGDYEEGLLEDWGWTVECESPLEIRHEDGSFATGRAAQIVVAHIVGSDNHLDVQTISTTERK